MIKENLDKIKKEIQESLMISGRTQDVKIIAVTKKQKLEKIKECLNIQLLDLGENYLQEVLDKMEKFPDPRLRWHFIGTVQSKKVKNMLGKFNLWHGVDRLSVLEELNKRNLQNPENILLQVNVGDEKSKSGIHEKDLPDFLIKASQLKGFSIKGLMTMPPLFQSESLSRSYFSKLRTLLELSKNLIDTRVHTMNELSMGTSQDYTLAVQEGATILRLGEILIGPRESE